MKSEKLLGIHHKKKKIQMYFDNLPSSSLQGMKTAASSLERKNPEQRGQEKLLQGKNSVAY